MGGRPMSGRKPVRLAKRVQSDLDEIVLAIARRSSTRAALRHADELVAKCYGLAEFPMSCRLRPEYGEGIRVAIHKSHVIFFRILPRMVRVERIIYGARDLPRALGE